MMGSYLVLVCWWTLFRKSKIGEKEEKEEEKKREKKRKRRERGEKKEGRQWAIELKFLELIESKLNLRRGIIIYQFNENYRQNR